MGAWILYWPHSALYAVVRETDELACVNVCEKVNLLLLLKRKTNQPTVKIKQKKNPTETDSQKLTLKGDRKK